MQAIAQALAQGGGTAQAISQATAQAYSRQPAPVAQTLGNALTKADENPAQAQAAGQVGVSVGRRSRANVLWG
jgi:hypothetical protein